MNSFFHFNRRRGASIWLAFIVDPAITVFSEKRRGPIAGAGHIADGRPLEMEA